MTLELCTQRTPDNAMAEACFCASRPSELESKRFLDMGFPSIVLVNSVAAIIEGQMEERCVQ